MTDQELARAILDRFGDPHLMIGGYGGYEQIAYARFIGDFLRAHLPERIEVCWVCVLGSCDHHAEAVTAPLAPFVDADEALKASLGIVSLPDTAAMYGPRS